MLPVDLIGEYTIRNIGYGNKNRRFISTITEIETEKK